MLKNELEEPKKYSSNSKIKGVCISLKQNKVCYN